MKKPYCIDKSLEPEGVIYAMMILPGEFEDYDHNDKLECMEADAMKHIVNGEPAEGKRLLEECYAMGDLRAGNILSYGYGHGWFGPRDYNKEVELLRQLVKKKYPPSMNNLGCDYLHGIGVKKSAKWAIYWFKKAAEQKYIPSIYELSLIYRHIEQYKDIEKGLLYTFWAADYDDCNAHNQLGNCYRKGIGMPKDEWMAFEHYEEAVEKGAGAFAEDNLFWCYYKGIGIEVDLERAEYYRKEAEKHGFEYIDSRKQNDTGQSNQ